MAKKNKRYIERVPDIDVVMGKDENGDVVDPKTLDEFITDTVLSDNRFGISRENMKIADAIEEAVNECEGLSHIELRDTDWKLLSQCAAKPQFGRDGGGYIARIGRQLLPFIDAICDAEKEEPSGAEADEPKANGKDSAPAPTDGDAAKAT